MKKNLKRKKGALPKIVGGNDILTIPIVDWPEYNFTSLLLSVRVTLRVG